MVKDALELCDVNENGFGPSDGWMAETDHAHAKHIL